jgi:tRNA A-37 threonylcarbamoyl transferase component Bud32/tetratricopeptide (TPR) repeat protein
MDLAGPLQAALTGRYEIERELGRGGMAYVFRARDIKHQRYVAIKVLRPELSAALGVERFLREIRISAGLQHPHIVPVFDSGTADDLVFFVMPLVDGESLRDRLRRERQLRLPEALRIAQEVADALGHAHDMGIVHRDVKPENILLAGQHALVADFGVARAVRAAVDPRTSTGLVVGTPTYMSPEQAGGEVEVDGRSDLYALGCVTYEMLAGEPPFSGSTPQAVLARHALERPPSLSVVRPGVPPALVTAIERALAKVPADRFTSVRDFATALGQSPPPARRRWRLRRLLGIVGLAAIAGFGAWRLFRGRQSPLDPHRVVVFPFGATVELLNARERGWDVALAIGAGLEHSEPLKWIDGWGWLDENERSDPSRVTPPQERAIARARGARFYVDGAIRMQGGDSSVVVRLHDVRGDSLVAQESAIGGALADLALDAVVRLLPRLLDPGRQVDLSPLTDRDPGAVALSIQGDREYRRSHFEEALGFYQRAVAEDSLLAFAAVKGAQAASWHSRPQEAEHLLQVAVRHESLLPPKYRRFARGLQAYVTGAADTALTEFRGALALDTVWSEAWMAMGEVYYHLQPTIGALDSLAATAFGTAVAYDTSFTPALLHLAEIAVRRHDLAGAERLADRLQGTGLDSTFLRQLDIMLACLRKGPGGVDWKGLAVANPNALGLAARELAVTGAFPGCGTAAFGALLGRSGLPASYQWAALLSLQGLLLATGHAEAALATLDSALAAGSRSAYSLYVFDALAGAPFDAEAAQAEAIARAAAGDYYDRARPESRWLLGIWQGRRGSVATLDTIARRLGRAADSTGDPRVRVLADALAAHLALARADTTTALARLERLRPHASATQLGWELGDPLPFERFLLAELLLARGRPDEAIQVADTFDHPGPMMYLPLLPASLALRVHAAEAASHSRLAARYRERLGALGWRDRQPPPPLLSHLDSGRTP